MEFNIVSSPKHDPFPVEETFQLDLLRILVKVGVSLQIQDTLIDWTCYYSRVNKMYNSRHDFWIRHNVPGREPFLNNLTKKVRTTGHRHHICRVLSDYDGHAMSVVVYYSVTELLSLLCEPVVMEN